MSLEFRGEVWTADINLGVISVEVILKTMKLDEIIRGWMWMKRKVQQLSPGEDQTQSSDAAIIKKKHLQIPRLI